MFPKFLSFCKTQHRTPKINSMLTYICQNISKLSGNKKGTNLLFLDLSQEVIPLVQNSNSFLEDLRRLNQLKDTSLSITDIDTAIPPHKFNNKTSKLKR